MKIHQVYKKIGQTPLEALESFRKSKKIPTGAKLTYAGRLDPMAEGMLLVLEAATQTQREKFLSLPKVYEAEVLFGFSTDSFDILGLATLGVIPSASRLDSLSFVDARRAEGSLNLNNIIKLLKSYEGKTKLPIPPYSSVPVKGRPLFEWTKAGKLKEIKIPKREMVISQVKYISDKKIRGMEFLKAIQYKIKKVNGDFRQEEIIEKWTSLLKNNKKKYLSVKIIIKCESGTYVRSIANSLGQRVKTGAILLSLKRLSVGKYKLKNRLT